MMTSTTRPTTTTSGHSRSSNYQLPYELERAICEIAAYNLPTSVPNLIMVAHRFRIWFEPELYRIIRCGDRRVIPPLYVKQPCNDGSPTRVLDKPRIRAFGHHVQHALLQKRSLKEIAEILECCPNVSNLALWLIDGRICRPLIPFLEKLPLRRLSFDPTYFFLDHSYTVSLPFNQPMFHHLTHLHIINAFTEFWWRWEELALLPKLTHLAIAGDRIVLQALIDRVAENCPKLELIIGFQSAHSVLPSLLRFPQNDDRVVILNSSEDPLGQWEIGARGGEDFWLTARIKREQEILARKHGVGASTVTSS